MPHISEEKYKRYRELNNLDLNKKLKEAINELDYNKIRSIISDDELESIDDEIYGALFLNKYPRFPEFLLMLGDSSSSDVVNFFIQHVPSKFLCGEGPRNSLGNIPCIEFIFRYRQDAIPTLLEAVSKSDRDDTIVFGKGLVSSVKKRIENIESNGSPYYRNESCAAYSCSDNPQDYYDAKEAIEEYCTQNGNGDYEIVPDYLFTIKDQPRELKRLFIDIAAAIRSDSLDKVQSGLKAIEASVPKADLRIIDKISTSLSSLIKKAKENVNMARAISDVQANITWPGTFLKENVLCTNSVQKSKN